MGTLILTLTLTNILLIVGIAGTVIGITHLIYPSGGRHDRPMRERKTRARGTQRILSNRLLVKLSLAGRRWRTPREP
jgi:hypothetical protein